MLTSIVARRRRSMSALVMHASSPIGILFARMTPDARALDAATRPAPRALAASVLAATLAACVAYRAEPLPVEETPRRFLARTLDDPELVQFLKENLPADAADRPETWTPRELVLAALHRRRELEIAAAHVDAARAATANARALPDPTLALDSEYTANADARPWAIGWTIDLLLDASGRRARGVEAASVDEALARLELESVAWDVRSEVIRATTALVGTERELAAIDRARAAASARVAAVGARLALGDADRGELVRARGTLARLDAERSASSAHLVASRSALAAALAVPASALEHATIARPDFDDVGTADSLETERDLALHARVDLRRARLEHARADASLRLEIARQYPDVSIAPGMQWDRGDRKWRFALALPIPLWNGNRAAIAEAEARRHARAAEFAALQERAIGEVEALHLAAVEASRERERLHATLAGAIELEALVRRAYDAGGEDALALADAALERANAEREEARGIERVRVALDALEIAVQAPLDERASAARAEGAPAP